MASFGRGRGIRMSDVQGFKPGVLTRYSRYDNNFFAVLGEHDEAVVQDGGMPGMFTSFMGDKDDDDGFTVVRGKQSSKRQRISSSGQSGQAVQVPDGEDLFESDFSDLSTDQKLSLILSKLSVNENRVSSIQNKLSVITNVGTRVSAVENVVRSQHDRLKLLEYRSIDLEARSRRKNLLFKGIAEKRQENCFGEIRRVIRDDLGIDRDMYIERAHRLGRFDSRKTRPIIVAFRDFCDTLDILDAAPSLRGTGYGVCKDYPSEISKARQSLWKQFKETREANPGRKVTLEYPAAIYVNGVLVADAFPDWYPTLQGSRVSVNLQTQSQTQSSDKSAHRYSNNVVTGLASSSGARPRDLSSNINARPLNLSMNGADLTANSDVNITNSQMSTQSNVSSPNRMDEEAPFSPSLINSVPPRGPKDQSPVRETGPPPASPPPSTRGRSPTRKVNSSRPRNQSTAPRGCARDRSAKRPTARSLSIGSQTKAPPNDNQAAGGIKFKKPGPRVANQVNGDKTDSSDPNQTEPQPPDNSQK